MGLVAVDYPVLVLGGTSEARALAAELAGRGIRVVSSLAGRVERPRLPVGEVRVGGFGGPEGLAAWLVKHHIAAVVDATHPFAERISASAAAAARRVAVPLLRVERPGWGAAGAGGGDRAGSDPSGGAGGGSAGSRDDAAGSRDGVGGCPSDGGREQWASWRWANWQWVASLDEAAGVVGELGSRVFLTTGRGGLAAFAALERPWFLIRCVQQPEPPLPARHEIVLSRGPYTVDGELELMRRHGIDVLVTKDSGGAMTAAKLDAAGHLGVPVLAVHRPHRPEAPTVSEVAEAVRWVLAGTGGAE